MATSGRPVAGSQVGPYRSVRRPADGHHQHRAEAAGRQQQAGLERRGAAHRLVVEGNEQHRAEHRDREQEERARGRARARVRERPQVDERVRAAPAVDEPGGDQHDADERRAPRAHRAEAVGRGLGEAEDEHRQPGREQQHPEPVEPVGGLRLIGLEHDQREDERDDPDRQVDEEDPAPGRVVDQPAAEDRAQDRRDQHRHAEHAHHAAHAVRTGLLGHDRHDRRHDHPAADALQDAEQDQRARAPRQARQHRSEREQHQRPACRCAWCRTGPPPSR